MSLQVWLPLNGSLENRGLEQNYKIEKAISGYADHTTLISNTINGKVTPTSYKWELNGQAISINKYMNQLKKYSTYSISCWLYYTDKASHEAMAICSSGDWNVVSGKFNFALWGHNGTGYTKILVPSTVAAWNGAVITLNNPSTIQPNKWYHLCLTCDSKMFKLYVNGILQENQYDCSQNSTIPSSPSDENLFIGCATYYNGMTIKGSINDFRIYDHCLSPREVKYLVQGLVAHYKLTEQITPATEPDTVNLLAGVWRYTDFTGLKKGVNYNGLVNQMGTNSTIKTDENCLYLYGGSDAANNNTIWPRCYGTIPVQAGKTYTVSCDYCNKWQNNVTGLRIERYGGDYNWNGQSINYSGNGSWQRLSARFTNTSDTILYIFFYCEKGQQVYINNIQLEEGRFATPYTPGRRESKVIIGDCSGYGNIGIIPKSLTATTSVAETNPPPKYGHSTSFNATNQNFVNCGRGSMVTDEITVSGWFYSDDWSSVTSSSNRLISCAHGGGWDFWPNDEQKMTMEVYRNGSYITGIYPIQLSQWADGWHHIVGTYDGYQAKIYVDCNEGVVSEVTTTKYPIVYNTDNVLFIGAEAGANSTTPDNMYFTGKISDVRIYATALSAKEIEEIYNASNIAFWDNGTLQCGEVIEDDSVNKIQLYQNGQVRLKELNTIAEIKDAVNMAKTAQLFDNEDSHWMCIHKLGNVVDVYNPNSYFTNDEEVQKCTDKINRFSWMEYFNLLQEHDTYEFAIGYSAYVPVELPDEYQQVAYISSSGTQYIDTGIVYNGQNIELDLSIAYSSRSYDQFMGFNGELGTNIGIKDQKFYIESSQNTSLVSTETIYDLVWKLQNEGIAEYQINGVLHSQQTNINMPPTGSPLYLFAAATSATDSTIACFCKCSFYGGRVKENNVIIREFIPCYLKKTKQAGLYDIIHNVFYPSNSATDFDSYGSIVNKLKTYDRWRQTNSPNVPVSEGSGYETVDNVLWYGIRRPITLIQSDSATLSTYTCGPINSTNFFHGAIGQKTPSTNGRLLSPSGSSYRYVELWVRIDNQKMSQQSDFSYLKLSTNGVQAHDIYEI